MRDILDNPFMQLFLIVGSVAALSWISQREEARRVRRGLPRRSLKERVLEGLGFQSSIPAPPQPEDIWVKAARELGLPLDKVLLLKERVTAEKEKSPRKVTNKQTAS